MLNKKIKRTLCGLVASLCLVGSTVPVFAETVVDLYLKLTQF